ncbi:hypothetical protein [Microbacterium forte]|uniref:hypothetical protein n=1 Tax=Microbacterium forte TaxID=2982533 RepID=UPI0028935958|nr:hypothetical protein [Microbacterium sp. A(2022)]
MTENTWHQAYLSLLETLRTAQQERDRRMDFVRADDGSQELGWVIFERGRMLDAVNKLRDQSNAAPVDLDDVVRAETSACGHSDYTSKFAIRCADLVLA